jgi:hypothetical protein
MKVKGPRALALVELAANGTAHLIPVAILVDGQFYDASAYKAAPVPIALESGTVYEAERTGASLGLFTVTGALQGPNNTWAGAGTWMAAGSKPASAAHRAEAKPRDLDEDEQDGPPVLRRREAEQPKPAEPASPPATSAPTSSAPTASTPTASAPASTIPPSSTPAPSTPTPPAPASSAPTSSAPATPAAPSSATTPASSPQQDEAAATAEEEDADRPTLHRGKPLSQKKTPTIAATTNSKTSPSAPPASKSAKSAESGLQILAAISDAGGPQPHSYAYMMKPDEEQQFRKKILTMATGEIAARAKQLAGEANVPAAPAHSAARRAAPASAKTPQPTFDDVQLHVIDPSSSNEPILILTARARIPMVHTEGQSDLQYMITLVTRQDIYGDLHKVFSSVTDAQHLDVLPRYDFIDAVDADGDGRAELLFRRVSDSASAFTIYRVIGNQLWPLFEGSLGE